MTEFVGYYESHIGHYMPIIIIDYNDGNKEFKEMKKEDILRIPDDKNIPGTWLFKKGQSIRESWQKRYMIVRASYLFYFHNHESPRPVGVIPLENCFIVEPPGGGKSFSEQRFFRANDGYEFEVRHPTRRSFLVYATSEEEREFWVNFLEERTGRVNGLPIKESHILLERNAINGISKESSRVVGNKIENVSITLTQLPSRTQPPQTNQLNRSKTESNPQYQSPSVQPTIVANSPTPVTPQPSNPRQSTRLSTTPFSPPPPPNLTAPIAPLSQERTNTVTPITPVIKFGSVNQIPIAPALPPNVTNNTNNIGALVRQASVDKAIAESTDRGEEVKRQQTLERQMLEKDLQEKMRIQQEGRKREALARERAMSRQRVEAARALESKNPMTLAELFRLILFFVNEELVEEPLPDTPLQFPHLKGEWAENMLATVYRRYCRSSGYMSLEEFVEFLEDSAILQTHVPHDENDEPLAEFQAQLDPVRLLTTVPRNLGYSLEMESELNNNGIGKSHDNFIVNFAQFYQLLLRIAHVVYADLYSQDPNHALNKLLQESILPLYGWTQGHSKRGSTDPLVTEERIVLLLSLYAPNLWKVFLLYCQDHQAKVPELNLPYPDAAKGSERILFGVPYGAPFNRKKFQGLEDIGYFMADTACLKFCQDYGLSPHLMSTRQLKQLLQSLNRDKALCAQRKLQEDAPPTVYYQKTLTTQMREQSSETMKKDLLVPMHFHGVSTVREADTYRGMGGVGRRTKQLPLHLTNPAIVVKEHGGLGFSEFVELIARIALDGMQAESYHVLFPTPFSKVLAILTVWGVADLRKIEEVRILRTETLT